jgi:hypothetical protein
VTNTIRRLYAEWRFRRFSKRWNKAFNSFKGEVEGNDGAVYFVQVFYKDGVLPEMMWEPGCGWVHRPKDDAND